MPSLSTPRYNVTVACDSCRHLKVRCRNIGFLDQPDKCSECLKHNVECTYSVPHKKRGPKPKPKEEPPTLTSNDDHVLLPGLSHEKIEFIDNYYELSYDSPQEEMMLVSNNYKLSHESLQKEIKLIPNYNKLYMTLHDLSQPVANNYDSSQELVANINELYEMLCDLSQPIANDYELSRNSYQEFVANDQMEILTSTSSLPCQYENTAGHCCHMGGLKKKSNCSISSATVSILTNLNGKTINLKKYITENKANNQLLIALCLI
ncbi:15488_t:CDS:2 [Cetraspora pellucida]|uniref:15488_t:CDS:1 n=1 Tax=Cetraspora pellucida TaxID=1433469 RepID=A0A9N9H953_9GLOM|nr:15488_t:CDS:2 [Cetraspora pellucida]